MFLCRNPHDSFHFFILFYTEANIKRPDSLKKKKSDKNYLSTMCRLRYYFSDVYDIYVDKSQRPLQTSGCRYNYINGSCSDDRRTQHRNNEILMLIHNLKPADFRVRKKKIIKFLNTELLIRHLHNTRALKLEY